MITSIINVGKSQIHSLTSPVESDVVDLLQPADQSISAHSIRIALRTAWWSLGKVVSGWRSGSGLNFVKMKIP